MAAWRHGAWHQSPTSGIAILHLKFHNSVRIGTACSTGCVYYTLVPSRAAGIYICLTSVLQLFAPAPLFWANFIVKKCALRSLFGDHNPRTLFAEHCGVVSAFTFHAPLFAKQNGVEFDRPNPGRLAHFWNRSFATVRGARKMLSGRCMRHSQATAREKRFEGGSAPPSPKRYLDGDSGSGSTVSECRQSADGCQLISSISINL